MATSIDYYDIPLPSTSDSCYRGRANPMCDEPRHASFHQPSPLREAFTCQSGTSTLPKSTLLYQRRIGKKDKSTDEVELPNIRGPTPLNPEKLRRRSKPDVVPEWGLVLPPDGGARNFRFADNMVEFYGAVTPKPQDPRDEVRRVELYHHRKLPAGAYDPSWATRKLKQLKRRASHRGTAALNHERQRWNRLCANKRLQSYRTVLPWKGFDDAFKRLQACPKRHPLAIKRNRGFMSDRLQNRDRFSGFIALDDIWLDLQRNPGPVREALRKRLTLKLVRSARSLGNALAQLAPVDFAAATEQREEWLRDMNRLIEELSPVERGNADDWNDWYEWLFKVYEQWDSRTNKAKKRMEAWATEEGYDADKIREIGQRGVRRIEEQFEATFHQHRGTHVALMAGMFFRAMNDIPTLKRVVGNAGVALENDAGDYFVDEDGETRDSSISADDQRWREWTGEQHARDAWLSMESGNSGAEHARLLMWHLENWQRKRTIVDAWDEWLVEREYLEDEDEDMDVVDRLLDDDVTDLEEEIIQRSSQHE